MTRVCTSECPSSATAGDGASSPSWRTKRTTSAFVTLNCRPKRRAGAWSGETAQAGATAVEAMGPTGCAGRLSTLLTANEPQASKPKTEQRERGRFGNEGDRTEQSIHLAIDARREVERAGAAACAVAEDQRPEAARRIRAFSNRDGT